MGSITLNRFKISAKQLRAMSKRDREFVLLIGHALNELSFIYRCIFGSVNESDSDNLIERNVNWAQTFFFLRLHMSKSSEIWDTYHCHYRKHLNDCESDIAALQGALASRDELERYFSDSENNARLIRNGYGFHYPTKAKQLIASSLQNFDDDDEFEILIHRTRLNSFYGMCDFLIHKSMEERLFGNSEDINAQKHVDVLFKESGMLNEHILNFFEKMLGVVLDRAIDMKMLRTEEVKILDIASKEELRLSFFLDPTDKTD